MNGIIYDEIVKIKAENKEPRFSIAGDMNKKNFDYFENFADFQLVRSAPTRSDALLDLCYKNLFVESSKLSIPLWWTRGTDSDNKVALYNAAYIGTSYVKIKRRKITKSAEEKFCKLEESFNWTIIYRVATPNDKVSKFHEVIEKIIDKCFPSKNLRIRSDEDPWISDYIRRLIKKRNLTFRFDGRGSRWKQMKMVIRQEMSRANTA